MLKVDETSNTINLPKDAEIDEEAGETEANDGALEPRSVIILSPDANGGVGIKIECFRRGKFDWFLLQIFKRFFMGHGGFMKVLRYACR